MKRGEGVLFDVGGGGTDLVVCTAGRLVGAVVTGEGEGLEGVEMSVVDLLSVGGVQSVEEGIAVRGTQREVMLLIRL